MALAQLKPSALRERAKRIQIARMMAHEDECAQLEGQAMLAEIEENIDLANRNISAAHKELEFINLCIERIQPFREYAGLTDDEAHQAAQREEWKLELLNRAETHLLAQGCIPTDHFDTMRMHPDYAAFIAPRIRTLLKANEDERLALIDGVRRADVVKLIFKE